MTSKQTNYIQHLIRERHGITCTHGIPANLRRKYRLTNREAQWGMSVARASALIDDLKETA